MDKKFISWIITGVLAAVVVLQFVFPYQKETIVYKDKYVTDTVMEYIHDTVIVTSVKTVFLVDSIEFHDTVVVVDTSDVISDYFASKYVSDTLSNDSILYAVSKYTISQNALQSRTFDYLIRRPTTINVITPMPDPKGSFWIGLSTGGNRNEFSLRPFVEYQTKTDWKFGYGYDLVRSSHNLTVARKINIKNIWQRSKK